MIINSVFLDFIFKTVAVKLVLALLLLLALGAVYFTRGLATRYITSTLNVMVKSILLLSQLALSVVAGALLPNNYLYEIEFFQKLYEKSGIWIPITMVLSFILIFMITGIFFSLTLGIFFPQMKKEDL